MKEENLWLIGFLVIIVIALLGGFKNMGSSFSFSNANSSSTPEQKQQQIQQQITSTEYQVKELQKQVQAENEKKNASPYKDIVYIQNIYSSNDASREYISIRVSGYSGAPINITGWRLVSSSTGVSIKIPKSTKLFFANTANTEEDVYIENNDIIYINTGYSPNGSGLKINKCSGYLQQFQTWNPALPYSCPAPKKEASLASIPRSPNNDACLDYIENYPTCKIQTETLPLNWSYECVNFIYSKINYPSCVDVHKNDKDFYQNEWRIYLKRSEHLWKSYRENITLYDNNGKVVSTMSY